jgi:hypothetical protein
VASLALRSSQRFFFLLFFFLLALQISLSLVGKMLQSWANIVFTYGTSSHWIESQHTTPSKKLNFCREGKKCEMEKVDVKWVTFDFWSKRAHYSTPNQREKKMKEKTGTKLNHKMWKFYLLHSSLFLSRSLTSTAIFWQHFSYDCWLCSFVCTIDNRSSHITPSFFIFLILSLHLFAIIRFSTLFLLIKMDIFHTHEGDNSFESIFHLKGTHKKSVTVTEINMFSDSNIHFRRSSLPSLAQLNL